MIDIGVSDLKSITKVIKEKYGYDFSNYAMSSFKRRIMRILEINKISLDILTERIINNSYTREQFLHEITVNVTEMFRDPSFWKVSRNLLSEMFSKRDKIKIWHAGCSSGEEVYSMLIMLHEMGGVDKVEIVASDIDKSILSKAKEAKISSKNMEINIHNYQRFNGSAQLEKYFKIENDFWYFDKTLLQKVSFREIDLVKAIQFSKFDFVLCRNVLIYFNQNLQNDVLKLLHGCIFEGGILLIGNKESISGCEISSKFSLLNSEEKIFKKNKE